MIVTQEDRDLVNAIEELEQKLHDVVVSSGQEISTNLTAMTSVLCQMIAVLPEPHRDHALKTSLRSLEEGVEVFAEVPEDNLFAISDRKLHA